MENFRMIPVGALAVNCYLIYDEKSELLLVVDPGGDADLILSAARSFDFKRCGILLTHAHVDHIGALPEVYSTLKAEFVYLASGDDLLYNSPDNHILPYLPPVENLPRVTNVWPLTDVKVLFTPGHTPGSCCFYWPERKTLLSGDTLFAGSVGRTDLPGGSFAALEKSIRSELLTLPEDTLVYPGHGPRTSIGNEKQTNPYLT